MLANYSHKMTDNQEQAHFSVCDKSVSLFIPGGDIVRGWMPLSFRAPSRHASEAVVQDGDK
jgi:hypothetical protein